MINLKDKKGLIVGVANDKSIAYGCAKMICQAGGEVALTYPSEKSKSFIAPIVNELNAKLFLPLDVQDSAQIDKAFLEMDKAWGGLDFLIHSIAFAPKEDLQGMILDCSQAGFLKAMEVSCYSLIALARAAKPLMKNGGTILTMSYYGADQVVSNYNVMGPVKSALESIVRYLAAELGGLGIRVHALSPGPILTRAASALNEFNLLQKEAIEKSPEHALATIDDVGAYAAFLISDLAKHITGDIHYVDAGYHIID